MIILVTYNGLSVPVSVNSTRPLAACIPSLKDKFRGLGAFLFVKDGKQLPKVATPAQLMLSERDAVTLVDEEEPVPSHPPPPPLETVETGPTTHVIRKHGIVWKHITTKKVVLGEQLDAEDSTLCMPYPPMQMIYCLEALPEMARHLTRDPYFKNTQMFGAAAGELSEDLLGKAHNRGIVVNTKENGEQFAFYPKMFTVPHSCSPSAYLKIGLDNEANAFAAQLIATRELSEGEDVTLSLLDVCIASKKKGVPLSPLWPILPRDRRQKLLRGAYFISECQCHRCTAEKDSVAERALTGAFFLNERFTDVENGRLVAEMQRQYDGALSYSSCVLFLKRFTYSSGHALILHRSHWRMSTVRKRLMDMYADTKRPRHGAPPVPSVQLMQCFLDQLEVLSKPEYVAPMDALRIETFRRFEAIAALLPDHLRTELTKVVNERGTDIVWPDSRVIS